MGQEEALRRWASDVLQRQRTDELRRHPGDDGWGRACAWPEVAERGLPGADMSVDNPFEVSVDDPFDQVS